MLTVAGMFDDGKQSKLAQFVSAVKQKIASPVTSIRKVTVTQPKQTVMLSARTKPVVYNEWD